MKGKGGDGFGPAVPTTANTESHRGRSRTVRPSHSPWACAQECSSPCPHPSPCLWYSSSHDLHTTQANSWSESPTHSHNQALGRSLYLFLCSLSVTSLAEFSLGKIVANLDPKACIYRGRGWPTAWANRCHLLAEQVQPVLPTLLHKPPGNCPFFPWADRTQAHTASPHAWPLLSKPQTHRTSMSSKARPMAAHGLSPMVKTPTLHLAEMSWPLAVPAE